MFYLLGAKEIVRSIGILSASHRKPEISAPALSMRRAYLDFLQSYQPRVPRGNDESVEWVSDPDLVHHLVGLFNNESRLDDIVRNAIDREDEPARRSEALVTMQRALERIDHEQNEFAAMTRFVTKIIFAAGSSVAGGGSTSAAVGVIWADLRRSWSYQDIAEFFVHELGHSLMFLDELRHRHYVSLCDAVDPRSFALSAVLKTKRPLDKVLHSLVVATDVLLAREHWLGHPELTRLHPPTSIMKDSCIETVHSIYDNPDAMAQLTDRGRDLVKRCESELARIAA